MNREKSLIKNTAVIALGNVCTKLISFVLLPLYTGILSTSEYGTVDVFNTYISLILPLATLMVEQGAFRYLILHEKEGVSEKEVVTSSIIVICILNGLFVLLASFLFQYFKNEYRYYFIPIMISASFMHWCLQIARGLKKLSLYSLGSVISAGTHIVLNVIFIAVLKMGARGMLIATTIGNMSGVFFLIFALKLYKYFDFKAVNQSISKKMLLYSVPLIPNTLSLWIINSSDRTVVNFFLGVSSNGLLAVSHKFPSIFHTIYSIFQLSWHETGTLHWEDPDRDVFFSKMIDSIMRLFSSACIMVIGLLPFVFHLLVRSQEYEQAYMTIPIYMFAVLLNIGIGLLGVVYVATKKTKEIAKTTLLAGIINILVHLCLIKSIGLYAAAISTFIAYLCVLLLRTVDVRKYMKLTIKIKPAILIILSLVVVSITYYSSSVYIHIGGLLLSIILAIYLCGDLIELVKEKIIRFVSKRISNK